MYFRQRCILLLNVKVFNIGSHRRSREKTKSLSFFSEHPSQGQENQTIYLMPVDDAVVNARLQSFPEGGDERRLLKTWLYGSSPAAQVWEGSVTAAHDKVELGLGQRVAGFREHERHQTNVMASGCAGNFLVSRHGARIVKDAFRRSDRV